MTLSQQSIRKVQCYPTESPRRSLLKGEQGKVAAWLCQSEGYRLEGDDTWIIVIREHK